MTLTNQIDSAEVLLYLANTNMPFGKYKGVLLIDLPEPYIVWFSRQGFPDGKLGEALALLYEIKANGLEYLFKPLRNKRYSGRPKFETR